MSTKIFSHSKKIVFPLVVIVVFFIVSAGLHYSKNFPSNSTTQKILDTKIASINPQTLYKLGDDKEFFDDLFSYEYKGAYVEYVKGNLTYNAGMGLDYKNQYFKNALIGFGTIAGDQKYSLQERAYALNMINLIYIASNWNDTMMKDSLYTTPLAKGIFEKTQAELFQKYPNLATMKDAYSVFDQSALLGAASQRSMAKLNAISYGWYSVGYSLMRERMNRISSEKRLWLVKEEYKNLANSQKFSKYIIEQLGKTDIEKYKKDLEDLDRKNMMFTGTGQVRPEIYIMKSRTLWLPLLYMASTDTQRSGLLTNYKNDFRKAVDVLNDQVAHRGVDKPMIRLFYVATLVDFGITTKNKNFPDETTRVAYVREAKDIMHDLIAKNNPAFVEKVKMGATQSVRPSYLKDTEEYYENSPYYQLRVLAQTDSTIQSYLVGLGWKF